MIKTIIIKSILIAKAKIKIPHFQKMIMNLFQTIIVQIKNRTISKFFLIQLLKKSKKQEKINLFKMDSLTK